MKARKRNSNNEWKEVKYVQLEDSDILYKEEYIEFQHDNLSTELKTFNQTEEEKHWQDVREKAAIAAMQGMLSNPKLVDADFGYRVDIEQAAVEFADDLIAQLI